MERADADERNDDETPDIDTDHGRDGDGDGGGGTATLEQPETTHARVKRMPPWNVLLHNDDVNDMVHVVDSILMLTSLRRHEALVRTREAHQRGLTLLVSTHREHAELLEEQFMSRGLTVTIEPER